MICTIVSELGKMSIFLLWFWRQWFWISEHLYITSPIKDWSKPIFGWFTKAIATREGRDGGGEGCCPLIQEYSWYQLGGCLVAVPHFNNKIFSLSHVGSPLWNYKTCSLSLVFCPYPMGQSEDVHNPISFMTITSRIYFYASIADDLLHFFAIWSEPQSISC